MSFAQTLETTATAFAGGTPVVPAVGAIKYMTFAGTWAAGDTYGVIITLTDTGATHLVGAGDVTGLQPTFAKTFKDKLYLLAGDKVLISCLSQPTLYNNLDGIGNDVITMTNYTSATEAWLSIAAYQGKLAFFSNNTILIWNMAALATDNALVQTLENIGTIAKNSVKSIGDLDVLFLAQTGIRSLRVRDSSNNAIVNDIGSPIDSLVATAVRDSEDATVATGVVEPGSRRYWLSLDGTIYVLSYFPNNKVVAWSTYAPTYESGGVQTSFSPEKFVISNGSIYCRATGGLLIKYGDGYDNAQARMRIPPTHAGDPDLMKEARFINASLKGSWVVKATMDAENDVWDLVWDGRHTHTPDSKKDSTYLKENIPWDSKGTHFAFEAISSGSDEAKISAVTVRYRTIPRDE